MHMRLCRLKLTRLRLKRRHVGYVTVTDTALCDILAISPHLAELQIVDKTENVRSPGNGLPPLPVLLLPV